MKFSYGVAVLLFLVTGTLTDDDFNLEDALGADDVTKPPKPAEKPRVDGGFDLNLEDAVRPDPTPKPNKPAVVPPKSGGDDSGFDLLDALQPDPKTEKPAVVPPKSGGGGGSFDDTSLLDVAEGDYKPDGGRSGGRASNYDDQGGADEPKEAGSGQIAGIASAIGVALLGAASSYFAYQKKKLCFKLQGGSDPESGKGGRDAHSDPQSLSNLLRTN
ncbi:CD99 molecule isoform X1 [Mugil cephalus]|uniref:CD99 molecule isoform X1 n=1 Tax=Mugil cephalus TaxID=48193 RepID=UPI001FB75A70|nr:CD99 molecule isoform X1 [Mugil cephalus]